MSGRDQLTPREVAERTGFSYHAVLRAIRRGDLAACEPIKGHYRIEIEEYERWRRTPAQPGASDRPGSRPAEPSRKRPRRRPRGGDRAGDAGSLARLEAIEGGQAA